MVLLGAAALGLKGAIGAAIPEAGRLTPWLSLRPITKYSFNSA